MIKKIIIVTGSRSDYGYLRPVISELKSNIDFEVVLIATGMHFLKEQGYSINEVKKDFPGVIEVPLIYPENTGYGICKYVSEGISKFADIFKQIKPDLCIFLGDRSEIFSSVQAAAYQNILIAHLHGGDVSFNIDNPIRHSISKFAHIHFPATKKSAKRLIRMGEEKKRIYIVGSTTLDEIKNMKIPKREEIMQKFNFDPNKPFLLIIQHPVSSQQEESALQMKITLDAVLETKIQNLVIYPNSDPGSKEMINLIKDYEINKNLSTVKNLNRLDYLGLLKEAFILIGNSSSGIIEAASFKTPVINIGLRQKNRERGENVIDSSHNKEEILKSIEFVLNNNEFKEKLKKCKNPYGSGNASEKIHKTIKNLDINKNFLQKTITY